MTYRLALKIFAADVAGRPVRTLTRARAATRAYRGPANQRLATWRGAVNTARHYSW